MTKGILLFSIILTFSRAINYLLYFAGYVIVCS